MFPASFCNHRYSRGEVITANHVPPAQRMIVMSRITPTYLFVTSRKITKRHEPFHLFYVRCADVGKIK